MIVGCVFFFKQKTAYEMRISDWSSDVCSSDLRDLLDLFTKSAGELLDSYFESEPLKAALGWDSVVGNFASPYTPGSAYVLLHHVFGEVNGKQGTWGHAIGGMGAITQAIAKECEARGGVVDTNAAVERSEEHTSEL